MLCLKKMQKIILVNRDEHSKIKKCCYEGATFVQPLLWLCIRDLVIKDYF